MAFPHVFTFSCVDIFPGCLTTRGDGLDVRRLRDGLQLVSENFTVITSFCDGTGVEDCCSAVLDLFIIFLKKRFSGKEKKKNHVSTQLYLCVWVFINLCVYLHLFIYLICIYFLYIWLSK